jgi:integrase
MPRKKSPVPSYRLHKPTGQAVVTVPTSGGRRDVYLGRYGSRESKAEYARVIAELRATPAAAATMGANPPSPSVAEALLAFVRYADARHRGPAGEPTRELTEYLQCVRLVRELYGHVRADEFGPLSLKAVRRKMVDARLCRSLVNRRVARIKRVFKWAASEQLYPAAGFQALATVAGLQPGEQGVRESVAVGPVTDDDVAAVLPFVRPEIAAMVRVQRLTGMRPGEVCALRPCDVDATGPVWLYRPRRHKSAWRGKPRTVAIGPQAQAVLAPFWPAAPTDHVFSPRRSIAAFHAGRTAARRTPRFPSHVKRNAEKRAAEPERRPTVCYTATSYGHAVAKGADRAGIPRWTPNQLRHSFATEVRWRYGVEAAGAGLGHSKLSATEVYAERDLSLALRVAAEAG